MPWNHIHGHENEKWILKRFSWKVLIYAHERKRTRFFKLGTLIFFFPLSSSLFYFFFCPWSRTNEYKCKFYVKISSKSLSIIKLQSLRKVKLSPSKILEDISRGNNKRDYTGLSSSLFTSLAKVESETKFRQKFCLTNGTMWKLNLLIICFIKVPRDVCF